MNLSSGFNLGNSKMRLSAVGYALRRLTDLESAWIAYFPEFPDKITVGLAIGYSAQALEAVTERIKEQNTIVPEYISKSPETVVLFDAMAAESDLSHIQQFIVSSTNGILQSVREIRESIDPLYDQPSQWAIRDIINRLEEKMDMLKARGFPEASEFSDPTSMAGVEVKWTPESAKPPLLNDPARPSVLRQSNENILNAPVSELLDSMDGRRRFVHFIYSEIEVAAAEICARNIAEYGANMPPQFTYDMARQCTDEARHAIMAEDMLKLYGGKLGDYTYRNHIWAAYMKGDTLAEKLAIEQIIGEGNGLDTTELSMSFFKEKGLDALLRYYEFLQADETIHCAFGNRWISHLVKGDETAFLAVVDSALAKTGGRVPGHAPVHIPVRRAAEFSETFINEKLLKDSPKDP